MDRLVGEPDGAEPVDLALVDRARFECQVDGEVAEREQPLVEPRPAVVVGCVSR